MLAQIKRAGGTEMTSTPRVSVLMAVYNSASFVAEAIESVLAQTMADLELVLVDDGCTDQSPEILARYAAMDPRVVLYRQQNQGIGGATNQALRLARAPYVAILDSDDAMLPERLAFQADYLDQHPDIAAVGSQWSTMDVNGNPQGIDRHPTDPDALFTLMFAYFSMHHPTIMARKEHILACGGYDHLSRQGCMDYALFRDILLAGNRMANLPQVLTRWRLNPNGVTHGKARQQTEDAVTIREKAFALLAARDSVLADQVALALVRTFPAGSWFDEKVSRLIPDALPSPALRRWREVVARGGVPELETTCVEWLQDELPYAGDMAGLLMREGRPWLAELARGKAGFAAPQEAVASHSATPGADTIALSVLMPTRSGDPALATRIATCLAALPENAEIVVFSIDGSLPDSPRHPALRILSAPESVLAAWTEALAATRGELLACLASDCQHHPDFLATSINTLRDGQCALVVAPADLYYPDALDVHGNPVRDPSPEPRWTRETLLGQDRGNLSCMVFRRTLLDRLPVALAEMGDAAEWAMARSLLTIADARVLEVRNAVHGPAVELANHIMATVIRRLVAWYLDTGLGSIPIPLPESGMTDSQGRAVLHALDARLRSRQLCIYPGNVSLMVECAVRYARVPWGHAVMDHLLLYHGDMTMEAMRHARPAMAIACRMWRTLLRIGHKLKGGAKT